MKKTLLILTFVLVNIMGALAQTTTDADNMKEATQSLNKAKVLYQNEQFGEAIALLDSVVTDVANHKWQNDSLYACVLNFKARCHFADGDTDKALQYVHLAVDTWREKCDTTSSFYALALDNLAFYLSTADRNAEAIGYSDRSLAIYDHLFINDFDKAIILFHNAEISNELGQNDKAVNNEKLALNILKREYGEHSRKYINELPYLANYYKAAGKDKEADEVEKRVETLKQEAKNGVHDIPDPVDSSNPEECKAHTKDALFCANYYLTNDISAPGMINAAVYCMEWGKGCHDVTIFVGKDETNMLQNEDASLLCAFAYYTSCVKYAIEHKTNKFSRQMFGYAVRDMVNFYFRNEQLYKDSKVASIEKYVKAYTKGGDAAFDKLVDKNYDILKQDALQAGLADEFE